MQFCGDSQPKNWRMILIEGKGGGQGHDTVISPWVVPVPHQFFKWQFLTINLFWIIFVITLSWLFSLDTVLGSFSTQKLYDGGSWGNGSGDDSIGIFFGFFGGCCQAAQLGPCCILQTPHKSWIQKDKFYNISMHLNSCSHSGDWLTWQWPYEEQSPPNSPPNYPGTGAEIIYPEYAEVCKDTWEMTKIWSCHVFRAGAWCFEVVCWVLACWDHLHKF